MRKIVECNRAHISTLHIVLQLSLANTLVAEAFGRLSKRNISHRKGEEKKAAAVDIVAEERIKSYTWNGKSKLVTIYVNKDSFFVRFGEFSSFS